MARLWPAAIALLCIGIWWLDRGAPSIAESPIVTSSIATQSSAQPSCNCPFVVPSQTPLAAATLTCPGIAPRYLGLDQQLDDSARRRVADEAQIVELSDSEKIRLTERYRAEAELNYLDLSTEEYERRTAALESLESILGEQRTAEIERRQAEAIAEEELLSSEMEAAYFKRVLGLTPEQEQLALSLLSADDRYAERDVVGLSSLLKLDEHQEGEVRTLINMAYQDTEKLFEEAIRRGIITRKQLDDESLNWDLVKDKMIDQIVRSSATEEQKSALKAYHSRKNKLTDRSAIATYGPS